MQKTLSNTDRKDNLIYTAEPEKLFKLKKENENRS